MSSAFIPLLLLSSSPLFSHLAFLPLAFLPKDYRLLPHSSNRRCFTVSAFSINFLRESIPTFKCRCRNLSVTVLSLASVLTPSGTMGMSETNSKAPAGILFLKAATKMVAVSISIANARNRNRYFLKSKRCSQTRLLVV